MFLNPPPLPTRQWNHHGSGDLVAWMDSLPTDGVLVLFNFSGDLELGWAGGLKKRFRPNSLIWLRLSTRKRLIWAARQSMQPLECLQIHFPTAWLEAKLSETTTPILPELVPIVQSEPSVENWPGIAVQDLLETERTWARSWMAPHLCEAARKLLDEARLTEFLFRSIFATNTTPDLVQSRTKRVATERVNKVKALLRQRLDTTIPLEKLAKLAGCTSSYLSRTFSEIEGVTLTVWLRKTRIDRAAELLASGKCNVSEAALEVGYQSLSHFSRAFREEKGTMPSHWATGK